MKELIKACKKVITKDIEGKVNGWLLEVNSCRDEFTEHIEGQVYLTVALPGCVKGFHIHQRKIDHFTCIKGKIKMIVFEEGQYKEYIMGEGNFITLKIPPKVPHAIFNHGKEEAYILNYCYPAYDPNDPDEEVWKGNYDFKKS